MEVHEVVFAAEPRYLAVAAGFLMFGYPIDGALRVLGQRLSPSPDSSQPIPPKVPL